MHVEIKYMYNIIGRNLIMKFVQTITKTSLEFLLCFQEPQVPC